MNRSVLGEDIMLCREGGREGGRGSKKVNEMENVAVMWSGWMAARRIGRKIGTLFSCRAVSDGFDRVLGGGGGDDNRVSLTPRVIHDGCE